MPTTGAKLKTSVTAGQSDVLPLLPLVVDGAPPPGIKPDLVTKEGAGSNADTQQSFIMKYWYYIIPVVLVLLMPAGDDAKAKGSTPSSAAATTT